MGLWQACPETDCPRVLLSQILFLIHLHFNPQSSAGILTRRSPRTKKAGPSVCVSLCPTLPIANVCHASLRRTTVTFSPPRPHHPPNTPKSPCLFFLFFVFLFSVPFLLSSGHWIWGLYSFIYSSQPFSLISSFCLLSLNRRPALICIFMGRCTVWAKTTGEFLYPADFSDINTIPVGPPKTGLIMQHSDCRFVFLFVIRIGDDSGRCKWDAQQGGADTLIYIHKACDICKRGIHCLFLYKMAFPFHL